MFAVMSPLRPGLGGGRRDLGAPLADHPAGVIPILPPGLVAVALFGFTLSYDEFARTAADRGSAEHAAARNLEHDAQRHLAFALRARHGDHDHLLPRSSASASAPSRSSSGGGPSRVPRWTKEKSMDVGPAISNSPASPRPIDGPSTPSTAQSQHCRRRLLLPARPVAAAARPRSCA